MKAKLLNLEKLEAANKNGTTVFRKGDLVKIKKIQGPGELKKLHRPYSNRNYEILRVLQHCNSLLLQEKCISERIRPLRLRVHMRYCKLVFDRELLKNRGDKIEIIENGQEVTVENGQKRTGHKNSDFNKGGSHTMGESQNSLIGDEYDEKRLKSETQALFRKGSRLRPRRPINYKQ